ncbi:hypothetical protein V6N13_037882 [Hibiscus sabdariffa]|uniref:Uncharacterized protein n=1 Tax=Hibiscus sabdariffa TaxID=183260 RepID=A0ABR2S3Q9_9ROSI
MESSKNSRNPISTQSLASSGRLPNSTVARIMIESEGDGKQVNSLAPSVVGEYINLDVIQGEDPIVVVGRSSVDSEVPHQPSVVTIGVDGSPLVPKPSFCDMMLGHNEVGQ